MCKRGKGCSLVGLMPFLSSIYADIPIRVYDISDLLAKKVTVIGFNALLFFLFRLSYGNLIATDNFHTSTARSLMMLCWFNRKI